MRLVLSISEKAVRALRVAAAQNGCRGVSAYVELLYGEPPTSYRGREVEPLSPDGDTDRGVPPLTGEVAPEILPEIVAEEGTLGEGHE